MCVLHVYDPLFCVLLSQFGLCVLAGYCGQFLHTLMCVLH